MNVLLVEDRKDGANLVNNQLADKHHVRWVDAPTDAELFKAVAKHLEESQWDVLCLDIRLQDRYGGIHLHNKLKSSGLGDRWTHTIVLSMYASPATVSESVWPQDEFPIRIFIETAGIPVENVIYKETSAGKIAQRIDKLGSAKESKD